MGCMSGAATALAGGAVGSAITLVAGLFVRASAVPREVVADDRMAAERDADLEQWVSDETLALRRRLHAVRGELNADGLLSSSEYPHRIGLAKERSLHAYRDQQRQEERDVARIFDREGWLHGGWRKLRRRPRYELRAPVRVEHALDVWRLPATRYLKPGGEAHPIEDPTARTLEQTLATLADDSRAFQ